MNRGYLFCLAANNLWLRLLNFPNLSTSSNPVSLLSFEQLHHATRSEKKYIWKKKLHNEKKSCYPRSTQFHTEEKENCERLFMEDGCSIKKEECFKVKFELFAHLEFSFFSFMKKKHTQRTERKSYVVAQAQSLS